MDDGLDVSRKAIGFYEFEKRVLVDQVRDLAIHALRLLDALELETVPVIGRSFGGMVAQELALLAPHRVSRLVLVSTTGRSDAHLREVFCLWARMAELGLPAELRRQASLLWCVGREALEHAPSLREYLRARSGIDRPAEYALLARAARAGERIVTLDGQTRELDVDDLVIADAERPVALAGVTAAFDTDAALAAAATASCAGLAIADLDTGSAALLQHLDLAMPLGLQQSMLQIQIVRSAWQGILVAAAVVVSPGIGEELLFRGLVFTGLLVHRGPRVAIVGSALLFAAIHFRPWQLPALMLFGLFLAALVYWTHSIYPAMGAHWTNNLTSVAAVNLEVYWGIEPLAGDLHAVAAGGRQARWNGLGVLIHIFAR